MSWSPTIDTDTNNEKCTEESIIFVESETSSQQDSTNSSRNSNNGDLKSSEDGSSIFSAASTTRNQVIAILSISYLCISAGNFLGYTSSAIVSMKEDPEFTTILNKHDESWIGSLGPLGAVCGGIFTVFPINRFGLRKTILYFGSSLFICSWVVVGNSNGLWGIFIGRFLGGLATSIIISTAPLYVVEISSTHQRGRLGVLPQGLMLLGILISYSLGTCLNWRWVARTCTLIALPSIILVIKFVPDTPNWIMTDTTTIDNEQQYNKKQLVMNVLEKFHSKELAKLEYERLILQIIQKKKETDNNNFPYSINAGQIRACLVAFGLMTFQQLTGINSVTFYAVTIFKKTGADESLFGSAHYFPLFLIVAQCFGSICSLVVIEKIGRKTLLLTSTISITITTTILATYFFLDGTNYPTLFWLPTTALIIYVSTFALGLGSTVWIYVSEILPNQIRTRINPIIISYTWFCIFLITKSFPLLLSEFGIEGVFLFYAVCGVGSILFVGFVLVETKGLSLEEIEELFSSKNGNRGCCRDVTVRNGSTSEEVEEFRC